MKLIKFKRNNFILRVSPQEAINIIRTISSQLDEKNPNNERREYYPEGCGYFSIAVDFSKDEKPVSYDEWVKKNFPEFFKEMERRKKILKNNEKKTEKEKKK